MRELRELGSDRELRVRGVILDKHARWWERGCRADCTLVPMKCEADKLGFEAREGSVSALQRAGNGHSCELARPHHAPLIARKPYLSGLSYEEWGEIKS